MSTHENSKDEPDRQRASWLAWLRPRFSLRVLLIAMFLLAVLLGVYARLQSRANRQRAIVAEAAKMGGYVRYDYECWSESPWYAAQRWLAPRTGPDLVGNVLILNYDLRGNEPGWLNMLQQASELQSVEYMSLPRADMTQEQVKYLSRFRRMKQLGLHDARDLPDLMPLSACSQLDKLSLHSCRNVRAEKLKGLHKLQRLKLIDVVCTDAQDEVARELANFVALEEVHVEFSGITHEGVKELIKNKTLRIVHLSREQAGEGFTGLAPLITFDVK